MKVFRPALALVVLAVVLFACGAVYADDHDRSRGRHRDHFRGDVDVVIGGPYWGPAWYYQPYYYSPYYQVYDPYYRSEMEDPPVYMERDNESESSSQEALWYYCPEAKKYYPYVRECPGGWQTVPAQPPSGQRR